KKDRPLTEGQFAEFERCYGAEPNGRAQRDPADSPEERWRRFEIAEVKAREYKLDSLRWLREESLDDGEEMPEPEELASERMGELEAAIEELGGVFEFLEGQSLPELQPTAGHPA